MGTLSRLGKDDPQNATTLDRIGAFARSARQAISPWNVISPTDVAGFAPGGGLAQAWQDSGRGLANLKAGNYGQAAADYGSMALNTLGEVVPYAKLAAILAPAAKYGPDIWTGASHGQARGHMMRDLPDAEIDKAMSEVVSGFIDSKKGFVDRNKAFDIARREGQLLPHIMDKRGELDSAMLIGNGRTTLPPVPDELLSEYNRLQAGARISDIGKVEPQGITAYHGSPHDFDRFDMSKIGTGEGAQAYGHGLYFAQDMKVAGDYQKKLGGKGVDYKGIAKAEGLDLSDDAAATFYRTMDDAETPEKLARRMQMRHAELRDPGSFTGPLGEKGQKLAAAIERIQDAGKGSLYQVRINANPDHFLDWDKPLSEQSEALKSALRNAGYDDILLNDKFSAINPPTPEDVVKLREAGIPGIKYLDAGSRSTGDGTRNYVVFDDKLVEILKKYGWVPGMAIPAAAMMEYQQGQGGSAPQM